MHEVSVATGILDIVTGECRKNGYAKIESVNVRIGRASGILPDALLFAFDTVKLDTIAAEAVLAIEEVPVGGRCNECRAVFTVDEHYVLKCPECGGLSFVVDRGREMEIVDMEVA